MFAQKPNADSTVAAVADPQQSRRLFYQLLAWGLSMTVVGALLCQLFAGAFAAII